jgi:hypothetical protein
MIKVVRIAGESFDLETRQGTPKSLVLSNGTRELSIPVGDKVALEVLAMMTGPMSAPLASPEDNFQVEALQEDAPRDVDDLGDEYNDPATGAGSL